MKKSLSREKIEFAKLFKSCKDAAINTIDICYHPECDNKSINSHILQKNGILSTMTSDSHLWEHTIDHFSEETFKFKRKGLNQVFSFNCYCNEHDTSLFQKIENTEIDFKDYESCLLFTLRTIYNEIFRKEVNIQMYKCFIERNPENFNKPSFKEHVRQEELGLKDLRQIENEIWNDYVNKEQSYVFEYREMTDLGLCLSSFYTYDTSIELNRIIQKTGKDLDRTSEIFINLFPYKNSAILLMCYPKRNSNKLRSYFYSFFREKDKFVQRKVTNLVLFNCETWVVSQAFYDKNVFGIDECYANATRFSTQNDNERQTFDLNFWEPTFKDKFSKWNKKFGRQ